MGNHISRTSAGRMRYTVRNGDTPENIASRILGDLRYAGLLVTINRVSAIQAEDVPGSPTQFVVLSRIDLPSESEMEIYSRHYFTAWTEKKSWLQDSKSSVSSFLDKMRDAAHRGAGRISISNPVSSYTHARTNFSADHRTSSAILAPVAPEAPTEVLSQQRLFDAFISGTR